MISEQMNVFQALLEVRSEIAQNRPRESDFLLPAKLGIFKNILEFSKYRKPCAILLLTSQKL